MSTQKILDVSFDTAKFDEGQKHIVSGLKEVVTAAEQVSAITPELKKYFDTIVQASNTKIPVSSQGGVAELRAQVEALQKSVVDLAKVSADVSNSQKNIGIGAAAGAKGVKQLTEEQALLKVQTQQANKETIEQAKNILAMKNAADVGGQTVEALRSKMNSLVSARDKKINILDPVALKEANVEIKKLKDEIDSIEQGGGNFKGNVGNYTESIKVLEKSLIEATTKYNDFTKAQETNSEKTKQLQADYEALTAKINQAKAATQVTSVTVDFPSKGGKPGPAMDLTSSIQLQNQLEQEIKQTTAADIQYTNAIKEAAQETELLTILVGQQSSGFTSYAREVTNTGKALETMHNQLQLMEQDGLENTETYEHLKTAFEELEGVLQKSKSKLTEFRSEQKILTDSAPKLAALTSAARGLGGLYAAGAGAASLFASDNEHVQKELNKLVAVMTLLQGLQEIHHLLVEKNAIATALFGTSTAAATVAVEGEAVAMEGATVAAGTFGKALQFIEDMPIILTLTALATVVIAVADAFEQENISLKKVAESAKSYSDSVNELSKTQIELTKISSQGLEDRKKAMQDELDAAKLRGISQQDELKLTRQIDAVQSEIDNKQLTSQPQINEKLKEQEALLKEALDVQKELGKIKSDNAKDDLKNILTSKDEGFLKNILGNRAGIFDVKKEAGEMVKDVVSANDELIKSTQASIDTLKGLKDKGKSADKKTAEDDIQLQKLNADEARQITLAAAQIEVSAIEDKNNLILANEKSSSEKRIDAMRSNQAAAAQLAKAERDAVVSDPINKNADGSSTAAAIIAEKQYQAKILQIHKDGDAEVQKEIDTAYKRRLQAKYDFMKSDLDANAKINENISKDVNVDLDVRMISYARYYEDQRKMVLADAEIQKQTKVLTSEEIIALDEQTKNKLLEIAEKSKQDISSILVSGNAEQLALLNQNEDLQLANEELRITKSVKNRKDRAEQIRKVDSDEQKKKLENDIANDLETLNSTITTDADKAKAGKDLVDKNIALKKLETANYTSEEQKQLDFKKQMHEAEKQLADETVNFISALVERGYTKQANAIQNLIDINNQFSEAETTRIQNSTINEQDKAAKLIQLQAATNAKNTQYAREQKDLQLKQAKFEKAVSIARIIEDTSVAVIKTLAETPPPVGLPLAILVGAIGAVQLATAIATPIPTYAEGTDYHMGGKARFGEKGAEAVKEPGKPWRIVDTDTTADLARGAKVVPLTTDQVDSTMYNSMMTATVERMQIVGKTANNGNKDAWAIARWQVDQNKRAIERNAAKVKVTTNIHNSFGWIEYVNKYVYGR